MKGNGEGEGEKEGSKGKRKRRKSEGEGEGTRREEVKDRRGERVGGVEKRGGELGGKGEGRKGCSVNIFNPRYIP